MLTLPTVYAKGSRAAAIPFRVFTDREKLPTLYRPSQYGACTGDRQRVSELRRSDRRLAARSAAAADGADLRAARRPHRRRVALSPRRPQRLDRPPEGRWRQLIVAERLRPQRLDRVDAH